MVFQLLADAIENREHMEVLPRLRVDDADIPRLPESFDVHSEFCWNFGWPVSKEELDILVDSYSPLAYPGRPTIVARLGSIISPMRTLNYYSAIRPVVVQPEGDVDWLTDMPTMDGSPGVLFFMVVSTIDEYHFRTRPSRDDVKRLREVFFGREPRWMRDAVPKSSWEHFYGASVY